MDAETLLDRLFRPYKSFPINGKKLTIRALSDPEQTNRALHATNKGRRLEKELADKESDVYQYRLRILENMSVEMLQALLKGNYATDVRPGILKDNPPVYRAIPDEPTEPERRETLNLRDEDEVNHAEKIKALLDEKIQAYSSKVLDGKTQEQLFEMAKSQIVETLVLERANMAYAHYTLYCAVMDEQGGQYFTSPDEVASMPDTVIFAMYKVAQEVNGIDPLLLSGQPLTA